MKKTTLTLLVFALIGSIKVSNAQEIFQNEEHIAINGYDVVNYFTDSKAVKGNSNHAATYKGATFYFASKAHKNAFKKNPEKYLPQFGGYCAFAVGSMNKKVPVNPETFKIVDGKLYLFFNDLYDGKPFNTLTPWNENESGLLPKANANWVNLKDQK